MTQAVVLLVLAGIWAAILIPPVVRARRPRPPLDLPGIGDTVEAGLSATRRRFMPPVVAAMALGFAAGAVAGRGGDRAVFALSAAGLAAMLPRLRRRAKDGVLVRITPAGIEFPDLGGVAWDQIRGVVQYTLGGHPQAGIVPLDGADLAQPGPIARLCRRLDQAYTGYPIWVCLPISAPPRDEAIRIFAALEAHAVPRLEPVRGGLRRIVRMLVWFLPP